MGAHVEDHPDQHLRRRRLAGDGGQTTADTENGSHPAESNVELENVVQLRCRLVTAQTEGTKRASVLEEADFQVDGREDGPLLQQLGQHDRSEQIRGAGQGLEIERQSARKTQRTEQKENERALTSFELLVHTTRSHDLMRSFLTVLSSAAEGGNRYPSQLRIKIRPGHAMNVPPASRLQIACWTATMSNRGNDGIDCAALTTSCRSRWTYNNM